jgi:hypothetical protein
MLHWLQHLGEWEWHHCDCVVSDIPIKTTVIRGYYDPKLKHRRACCIVCGSWDVCTKFDLVELCNKKKQN